MLISVKEYEGSPAKAPAVRQVAVKQMYDSGYGKIPFEVQLMENLTNAKSKHIVKMYKYVRRARLQDEIGNSYIGMYMEYCPGGVLGSLMGGDANLTPILVRTNFSGYIAAPAIWKTRVSAPGFPLI
jgi:hypothetical protein